MEKLIKEAVNKYLDFYNTTAPYEHVEVDSDLMRDPAFVSDAIYNVLTDLAELPPMDFSVDEKHEFVKLAYDAVYALSSLKNEIDSIVLS